MSKIGPHTPLPSSAKTQAFAQDASGANTPSIHKGKRFKRSSLKHRPMQASVPKSQGGIGRFKKTTTTTKSKAKSQAKKGKKTHAPMGGGEDVGEDSDDTSTENAVRGLSQKGDSDDGQGKHEGSGNGGQKSRDEASQNTKLPKGLSRFKVSDRFKVSSHFKKPNLAFDSKFSAKTSATSAVPKNANIQQLAVRSAEEALLGYAKELLILAQPTSTPTSKNQAPTTTRARYHALVAQMQQVRASQRADNGPEKAWPMQTVENVAQCLIKASQNTPVTAPAKSSSTDMSLAQKYHLLFPLTLLGAMGPHQNGSLTRLNNLSRSASGAAPLANTA